MQALRFVFLISLFSLVLAGCASTPHYRSATTALFPTNRGTVELFHDLTAKLHKYHYKILSENKNVGLLLTVPRQFTFSSNGRDVTARQSVEIHQEGGAVKVRLTYSCNYSGDQVTFVPCLANDAAATTKISGIDNAFIAMVRSLLHTPKSTLLTGVKAKARQPANSPSKSNPWASWGAAAQ